MFLLLTPERMKVERLATDLRSSIRSFSSPDRPLPMQYTNNKGKVIRPNKIWSHNVDLMPAIDLSGKESHLYRTSMSKSDLLMVKLLLPHACKVYVTNDHFIDNILQLLDILILTTSTKAGVEMDMWLPEENEHILDATMVQLRKINPQIGDVLRQAITLYNRNGPSALVEAKMMQDARFRKGSSLVISRNLIAQLIKVRFIKENIVAYSGSNYVAEYLSIEE